VPLFPASRSLRGSQLALTHASANAVSHVSRMYQRSKPRQHQEELMKAGDATIRSSIWLLVATANDWRIETAHKHPLCNRAARKHARDGFASAPPRSNPYGHAP
jgi:hypothetical protein